MKTLIIAEAGVNHNGDLALARRLVRLAADAGADVVKFQTFKTERLTTLKASKAPYQLIGADPGESQHDMLRRLELSREMHENLIAYCHDRKIEFFSTGFDIESVELLMELGVKRIKVPSGEITNLPYLRHVGHCGKPVILSTGMATLGEIAEALEVLERAGTPRRQVTVLQCNTEYPTPMSDANLRAMLTIQDTFNVAVGYSDHTEGIEVAVAAVAMGATIIEKHFTVDRTLSGPDHRASIEPAQLTAMISAIRNVEQALGDGIKRPSASEAKNISIARKSLVAAVTIRAGERFGEDNLAVKRPGTGLSPMLWDKVLGRIAPRDFMQDELIEL